MKNGLGMDKNYRIVKVLNHNAVIAFLVQENQDVLILESGIGFGRKVSEYIEPKPERRIYSLEESTERGNALSLVNDADPVCIEAADQILDEAEKVFGKVDRNILFTMADHLTFAIKRQRKHEELTNSLNTDIRILFHTEYKVAEKAVPILEEKAGVTISDDEIGLLALHIHSAIVSESVSQSLQTAQIVRECIETLEEKLGKKIDVMSIAYNRMMNHVRYMIPRILTDEPLKLNLNEYMKMHYPESFQIAEGICQDIEKLLNHKYRPAEIGYLAMHIERVFGNEDDEETAGLVIE
jgi:transcriptional antiterminator